MRIQLSLFVVELLQLAFKCSSCVVPNARVTKLCNGHSFQFGDTIHGIRPQAGEIFLQSIHWSTEYLSMCELSHENRMPLQTTTG